MNTQVSIKAIKVNDGTVRNSELPIWAGTSKVTDAVNGRLATMSVTKDRDWLWVRFSAQPSEKFRSKLVSYGFIYSRQRMAWHVAISELACKTLREFGAITIHHHLVMQVTEPPKPVEIIRENVDLDAGLEPAKPKAKSKKSKAAATSQAASSVGVNQELAARLAALEASQAQLNQALAQVLAALASKLAC